MPWPKTLLIAWLTWRTAWAISIDNDIVGDPDIECLEDEIRVWVKTRKIFAGRIYAKGRSELEECYKDDFARERTKKPHFDLKFGACGMKSLRSVDPRGMYYGITIVVSFHPLFITKVDQAFHVKCFFEEANKGLTAELGVSMIPTTELEARHGIPGCTYSIHSSSIDDIDAGRPAGSPIQFARVGDRVLHQWHCNDQMYGVLINSCYVTDGFGKKADVIDDKGCPLDPILITGIRYSSDLQRAYAESSVFKFADKPGVWFFCQVQMCMKKHGMCQGITPPSCGSQVSSVGNSASSHGGDEDYHTNESSSRQKASSHKSTSDYDYDSNNENANSNSNSNANNGGRKTKTTAAPRSSTVSDYDYDNTKNAKLHSPGTSSYRGGATPPLDYDTATEAVTVFGPAFNTDSLQAGSFRVTTTSESVSQTFETEDDLAGSETTTTASPGEPKGKKIGKSDYNDYDEVTIPPNLTDLLANLPDDLSSDSIQKMLRDSVDNPKALLAEFDRLMKNKTDKKEKPSPKRQKARNQRELKAGDLRSGDKIDQIEVDWTSTRRRDFVDGSPVGLRPVRQPRPLGDKPMISGQLLIYDLDEDLKRPEPAEERPLESACSISRTGLVAVFGGLGALCATLLAVAVTLFLRLHHSKEKTSSEEELTPNKSNQRFAYAQHRFF